MDDYQNNILEKKEIDSNNRNCLKEDIKTDYNKDLQSENAKKGHSLTRNFRCFVFIMAVLTSITLNMDHGTIPAITNELRVDLSVNDTELGAFGSLVYLGALILMKLINLIDRKIILIICLVLNSLFLYLFTVSANVGFLYFIRTGIGAFQAFVSIYFPVWVDQFGPKTTKTIMMAIIQVASPLGIVIGFALTKGLVMGGAKWKISFIIQAILLLTQGIVFFFIDKIYFSSSLFKVEKLVKICDQSKEILNQEMVKVRKLNEIDENQIKSSDCLNNVIKDQKTNMESEKLPEEEINDISIFDENIENPDNVRNFFEDTKTLLTDKLYLLTTLSVTTLLFISTAIVFWTSDYLEKVLKVPVEKILIVFIITCITAPALGIVIGGCIVQKLGGYETKHSILVCFFLSLLAWCISIPTYFLDFTGFAFCLWLILFFGGSIIPNLMGIMISTLEKSVRATGSSLSNIFMNLLGFLPAPFIYGSINDSLHHQYPKLAFWITLNYSFIGSILILIASIIRYKTFKENEDEIIKVEDIVKSNKELIIDPKIDNSGQMEIKNEIIEQNPVVSNEFKSKNGIDDFNKEIIKFNSHKGNINYINLNDINLKEISNKENNFNMDEIIDLDCKNENNDSKAQSVRNKKGTYSMKNIYSVDNIQKKL